jgi:hypothetical protein
MGRKSAWAATRAEVIASGVMIAGSGVQGRLPPGKLETYIEKEKYVVTDTFLSYGLHMASGHPQGLYNYIYSFECTVSYVDFA